MLFSLQVSSGQFPIWPETTQPALAVTDKLSELTFDEPLPAPPPVDEIRLLVQSPFKLFLYWNHARDPVETLRRTLFGERANLYRLIVRLVDLTSDEVTLHEAAEKREQFFNVRPDRAYRAEVGFFASGRPFIRLLASNIAQTPRSGIAHRSDTEAAFNVSAEEFTRALNESGYASDALEVALEAADEQMRDSFTRIVAQTFTGADTGTFDDGDLSELRAFLAAIAFGAPIEQLRFVFSPKVAAWFEQSFAAIYRAPDAARLIDILRHAFGLELDYAAGDEGTVFGHESAHIAWGASDVHLPGGRPVHLWLPSMTAGLSEARLSNLQRMFAV